MADKPKGPKGQGSRTLPGTGQSPKTTLPMPTVAPPAGKPQMPADDEWTTIDGLPEDAVTKPKPKFVELDDAATVISGMTHVPPPHKHQPAQPAQPGRQRKPTPTASKVEAPPIKPSDIIGDVVPGGITIKEMPAVGQRATLRDMPSPVKPAPPLTAPAPANREPDAPAAEQPRSVSLRDLPVFTAQTVREPSLVLPMTVEEPVSASSPAAETTVDAPKSRVWVATHKLPADTDPRLVMVLAPESPRAGAFRVLRHRLAETTNPHVIAVSSAGPGEGKSTCAVNLALALGEAGRARVLLVEANLRAPSLAALFGFLPPECFATQLARHRENPLDPWSVVEVQPSNLHVCAVKPGPENENRELVDGVALGIALDMLRRCGYDFIVIDTPSVLGGADVNLVQDCSDGVLLTAWSRKTSSRALRRALEQLSSPKVLGVAVLDV